MPTPALRLAVRGRLRAIVAAEQDAAARGYTKGMRLATDALKLAVRAEVMQAGLGKRLANTWRGRVYPERGYSLGAAGFVWTKAPEIMRGHAGVTIRSADGFYLAIPTDAVPAKVLGKRTTPGNLERAWGIRLRIIPGGGRSGRSGKPSLLVADLRRRGGKRGGFAAPNPNAKRKQKLTTVPLFILLPQVRLRRRLDIEAVSHRAANGVAALVAQSMEQELRSVEN